MAQLSRRAFTQLIGSAAAATALRAAPQTATLAAVPRTVRLSANENPYGPPAAALQAMRDAFPQIRLYPDEAVDELIAKIAALHGVSERQVLLGDGSSEILQLAAKAFTDPKHALVTADPTFEALAIAARMQGADVKRVPLDARYAHDVARMLEAAHGAGLVYICNPNNPTATITPDASLRGLIGATPADTTILIDEAYHHYATSSEYSSVMDLVAKHPNLIVSRTFSKIFGLAGLRCGYCVAQEGTIRKLSAHQAWDSVNIMALVAARASLLDSGHVADHRKRNSDTRAWLRTNVTRLGMEMLPSEANFAMIDIQQDVKPVIQMMRANGVAVGRLFPAMPHHLRVTIGTPEEMQRFAGELAKLRA
ncbi:MAG: pyridoxal phosphate-dependent aminotransferase [Thermoanaerobaculia bacterium]